ncbi:B3 domain-containing transcription factor VRN1-like [Quillaja saponaria]|uniref:B3 domain-containing transcription factor VRN1-like n=1 Tax=Quillaja saponaria TaxID=32244 RepID=A0AAD7PU76_QUISA|nr:B3 domain-containing transcription factor VRN1-like [Quillaja saponaria]
MSLPGRPEETQNPRTSLPRRPCLFYKLMEPSIIQGRKMKIPKKFLRKFGDELSEFATLVLPNGDDWLVKLRKADSKLWFDSGWHLFVEHYSIRAGYLIVFKYEGDSKFRVSVFDLTAYPLLALGKKNRSPVSYGKETQVDESLEILGSCRRCSFSSSFRDNVAEQTLHGKSAGTKNSMSGLDGKNLHQTKDEYNSNLCVQPTRDIGIQFVGSDLDGAELHILEESKQIIRKKQRTEPMEKPRTRSSSVTLARRHKAIATKDREESAIHAAEKFKPDNPHCRVILRRSYVSRCLYFPASFSLKYLSNSSGSITLEDSTGNKWSVRCIHDNQERRILSLGWSEFVQDNSLKEKDVCVFELVKKEANVLKVTVFRDFSDN